MSTKNFIVRTVTSLFCIIFLTFIVLSVGNVFDTIIENELAMGQLEHNNEGYVSYLLYTNTLRPLANMLLTLADGALVLSIILNTIKFIKNKKENIA